MKRDHFIMMCGMGCLSALLTNCSSVKYVQAIMYNTDLLILLREFEIEDDVTFTYVPVVVASHRKLRAPVAVFRADDGSFNAVLMRCTHQGTELLISGDRLHCPAHGSEFSAQGAVQQGPAESALKTFPASRTKTHVVVKLQ